MKLINHFHKKIENRSFLSFSLTPILLMLIFLSSVCSNELNPVFRSLDSRNNNKIVNVELERNRRLWQEKNISDYNFVCVRQAVVMTSWAKVLIQVRNRQAISIEPDGEPGVIDKLTGYEEVDTVEKMFNKIQEAYEKEYFVEVKYNKEYGYPEEMNLNSLESTDSIYFIWVSKFEVIN